MTLHALLGLEPPKVIEDVEEKHKKLTPIDILNAINTHNTTLLNEENEKEYVPYVVNRGLSFGMDTVRYANFMNSRPHLPPRLQFDFYINIIRPRKRYNKWLKADKVEVLDLIREYYGYSMNKARQVLPLVTPEHIEHIKNTLNKGGTNDRRFL